VRPSSGGKYIAVTLTIMAQSQEQLEAIHAGLNQLDGLRVLL
jgi:putative lipoic acid-binding regulatory protein